MCSLRLKLLPVSPLLLLFLVFMAKSVVWFSASSHGCCCKKWQFSNIETTTFAINSNAGKKITLATASQFWKSRACLFLVTVSKLMAFRCGSQYIVEKLWMQASTLDNSSCETATTNDAASVLPENIIDIGICFEVALMSNCLRFHDSSSSSSGTFNCKFGAH